MPLLVCSRSPCSLELSFSEPTLAGGKQSLQHVWQRFTKVPQIIFVLSFQNFILLYSYLLISLEPKHRTQFSTHGPVSIRFFACVTLANMEICHFALAKTFGYIWTQFFPKARTEFPLNLYLKAGWDIKGFEITCLSCYKEIFCSSGVFPSLGLTKSDHHQRGHLVFLAGTGFAGSQN